MNRHFYEVAARDRAADWRRDAERDRLIDLRPRRGTLVGRLLAMVRVQLTGPTIAADAPLPARADPPARVEVAPGPARLGRAISGAPPTGPQRR